jgi:hypothetical protein
VQSGTIGSAALDNTYTFSASVNDVVDFTAVTTSGSMNPSDEFYNGGRIASPGTLLAGSK